VLPPETIKAIMGRGVYLIGKSQLEGYGLQYD